jgi:hypothetical protein
VLTNLKESGAPKENEVLTIMQQYIQGSGISIKTYFAPHQNATSTPYFWCPLQTLTTNWKMLGWVPVGKVIVRPMYGASLSCVLRDDGAQELVNLVSFIITIV